MTTSRGFARPRIVFSACLNFEAVRYNGKLIEDEFCKKLAEYVDVVTVCPEVGAGLPVPRPPIVIVFDDEKRVVQKRTNENLTERLVKFSTQFLEELGPVDGFVLKRKSPSCAIFDATAYRICGKERHILKTSGLFTDKATEKFPKAAFIDEFRLKNFWLKDHFLTRVFATAELRETLNENCTKQDLLKFHERYKYSLMAHSPMLLKKLGKLVSNLKTASLPQLLQHYNELFITALLSRPTRGKHFNVLQHIYGYFKDIADEREKKTLQGILNDFGSGSVNLTQVREVFREFALKYQLEYLLDQRYLNPYPVELGVV